jgi:serine protease Do
MTRRLALTLTLIAGGFLAGLVVTGRMRSSSDSDAVTVQAPRQRAPVAAEMRTAATPDFTQVAERTVNGVTNISSLQVVRTPNSPFANDPFFRHFFPEADDMFGYTDRRAMSAGSGVVVSADGYILTNNHVVGEHMREISVVLADRRELRAKLVGLDPPTDVALLKVDATGLPALPWGDSAQLKVAEWVMAIGNPFQLSQTVTLGIVSAVGRANVGLADYEDFIQTDAAINPGNSGGALVNARGELIGINTAIFSQSGGYEGIGFAIPSNLARRVMQDLIRHGEVRRGSIGDIRVVPLTTQLAKELGAPNTRGAVVARMRKDSAAYAAGMQPGDVIVAFNGQPVDDAGHFMRFLLDAKIGSTVTIGILRDGKRMDIRVQVRQAPRARAGRV